MGNPEGEVSCEVCGGAPARKDDLLCPDCSRAFVLMLELLHNHPELDVEDLRRIKDVFEWRMSKYGLTQPEAATDAPTKVATVTPTASTGRNWKKAV